MSTGRLSGKVAMVTGGSSGIGRAVCELFAEEGASVAIVGRNQERLQATLNSLDKSHDNKHCVIAADVTSADEAKQSFVKVEQELGKKATILVNNAGIITDDLFIDVKVKDWDHVIEANLKGKFLMAQEFLLSIKDVENANGSLVNMSSMAGKQGFPRFSPYAASKFGVIGMSKTIAQEYQSHKVRSNAVLPGTIETPIQKSAKSPEIWQAIAKSIPMQRFGKPKEVAYACLYLASDESSYVNGACLEVSGGLGA